MNQYFIIYFYRHIMSKSLSLVEIWVLYRNRLIYFILSLNLIELIDLSNVFVGVDGGFFFRRNSRGFFILKLTLKNSLGVRNFSFEMFF